MTTPRTHSVGSSPSSSDLSATQAKAQNPRREKSKRPQLSCSDCRTRKVKCDRLQPCTACSLHQIANSCHYELTETERHPILQAEAIKLKDKEIARLRQENQVLRAQSTLGGRPAESDPLSATKQQTSAAKDTKKTMLRFKRPLEEDHPSISSFGAPCSSIVARELANLSFNPRAAGIIPRAGFPPPANFDIGFPFPTLWHAQQGTSRLVDLLPNGNDLITFLSAFEHYAPLSYFPCVPEECTRREVQKFLVNVDHNSLLRPDLLALLFAALAQGVQNGLYDRWGGKWVHGATQTEMKKGDVFVAAAMHALRTMSFMSRPTLLVVETLLMIGPYLMNSGKYLDAWSLFGITVRLAQAIGLHCSTSQLEPHISATEAMVRKKLWWWMLYMDQQYSLTLNRPLAISSVADCVNPAFLAQSSSTIDLELYNARLAMLGRNLVSAGNLCNAQIEDFTNELVTLLNTLPETLKFSVSWIEGDALVPSWPLNVQVAYIHSLIHHMLVLVNRQRSEAANIESSDSAIDLFLGPTNYISSGREQVLESCRSVLQVLRFFHARERGAIICWTVCQQAFNAAWILMVSMLETRDTKDSILVQQAYGIFLEIHDLGIHSLASAAVEKLGDMLNKCSMGNSVQEPVMGKQGMELVENLGSQGFVFGARALSTFHVNSNSQINSVERDERMPQGNGESLPIANYANTKKQKMLASQTSLQSRASATAVSMKQRRSSVSQRRYSGLWMKDQRSKRSNEEDTDRSVPQPAAVPDSNMKIGAAVSTTSQSHNAMAGSLTGLSNAFGDTHAIPISATEHCRASYDLLSANWPPYQLYTGDQSNHVVSDNSSDMHRSFSGSYSEHSADPYGQSQNSTQFSSPTQSQHSSQPLSSSSSGSINSLQPQILPQDVYTDSVFGFSSMQTQTGTLELAPATSTTYQISEGPNYAWHILPSGLRVDCQR